MSAADVAIGLTLEDEEYNQRIDRADRKMRMLGEHKFTGAQAGAKNLQKGLQDVERQADRTHKKLTLLQQVSSKAQRIGEKADKIALAFGGASLASKAAAMYSGHRMKKAAGNPGDILKWQMRRDMFAGLAEKTGKVAEVAGAVSIAGRLAGWLGGGRESKGIHEATGSIRQFTAAANSGSTAAQKFGSSLGSIAKIAAGVTTGILGANGIIGAFGSVKSFLTSGIAGNSNLEQATAQFEIFTGSAAKAREMMAALRKDADKSPFSTSETLSVGASLVSMAGKDTAKLMDLVKTAQRLTVLNPNKAAGGGFESASIALKNALSGDVTSMQDRFNIAPAQINAVKAQGLSGLPMVKQLLNNQNVTEDSVGKMGKTYDGMLSTLDSFWERVKQKFAEPLFEWMKKNAEKALTWIDQNGQRVLDFALGLGDWIQKQIDQLMPLGLAVADWFKVVMVWVETLPGKLAEAWSGDKFSSFFSTLGENLMNIAQNVASLLFDTLMVAGDGIGAKIRENLPKILGGGKNEFDSAKAEAVNMDPGKRTRMIKFQKDQMAQLASHAGEWSDEGWEYEKHKKLLSIYEGTDNLASVFQRHRAGLAKSFSTASNTVQNFVGQDLGWTAAKQLAASGQTGLVGKFEDAGRAIRTAGETADSQIDYKKRYSDFIKARDSVLGRANKAAEGQPAAIRSSYLNAAQRQSDDLYRAFINGGGASAQPTAASTAPASQMTKQQIMQEKYNAKAQNRTANIPAKVQLVSADDQFHPLTATTGR